jgi:beta-N-acetylhexosaminidase
MSEQHSMSIGPLMVDLEGEVLSEEDRGLLHLPAVGGVILFARNYSSPEQLAALTGEIRRLRKPPLLIAVDQEGGRVQRFREGFTRLPPASWYGQLYRQQPPEARRACELAGWLMAAELRCVGVDFSFAPVLDLDLGLSQVIGDRAFAERPHVVADLGLAWMRGVHAAGMPAVGKHFPGHGGVRADSHQELPVDPRGLGELLMEDLMPFERLIQGGLEAVMPAHVRYPRVDEHPAGFSPIWLREVLRRRLGFQGAIFSDDLSMGAAAMAGGYLERARAALAAGCDMILACNNRDGAWEVAEGLADHADPAAHLRMLRMHARHELGRDAVRLDPRWYAALARLVPKEEDGDLPLGPAG